MLQPTVETARVSLQQAEVEQIKVLAQKIRNTKHFRAILKDARPDLREEVYDLIAPLLEFKPPPFSKMMKAQIKRENKGRKST
jgi:hypothetical protein